MKREDIIKLAREAHLEALSHGKGMHVWHGDAFISDVQDFCVRFAALVAEHEREACAKVADTERYNTEMLLSMPAQSGAAFKIAAAIRARGDSETNR
jgi:hypothetical protein